MTTVFTRAVAAAAIAVLCPLMASAQPSCSAGRDAAGARIQLPNGVSGVTSLRQYAWDGAGRIVVVCDLTGNATSLGYWRLYSGEIDNSYPGICVGVSYGGGREQYSCASPRAVSIAFNSPNDSQQSILRFGRWGTGLTAN